MSAAERQHAVADLVPADPLVEKSRGVVAQYPDDRRIAADRREAREQRQQQAAANPLVLPVRRDVEREHFAGEPRLAAARAATAETDHLAVGGNRDAHVARFAAD